MRLRDFSKHLSQVVMLKRVQPQIRRRLFDGQRTTFPRCAPSSAFLHTLSNPPHLTASSYHDPPSSHTTPVAHRNFTQASKETSEVFMVRIDGLMEKGELRHVRHELDAMNKHREHRLKAGTATTSTEVDTPIPRDWQRGITDRLVEAWSEKQTTLLDSFHLSFPTSIAIPGLQQVLLTSEQRNLLQEIAMCSNEAHHSIESFEPLLSPKSIWLMDRAKNEARSTVDSPKHMDSKESLPADTALAVYCSKILEMWAKTMRASARGRSSEEFIRGVPQRIRFFMERMVHLGLPPSLPDRNHAMEAWAYSKEHMRATNAERIFETNEVNAASYRWMVWAWALSRERRSAYRATGHLRRMLRSLENSMDDEHAIYMGDMEPTLADYHVVLKAWAKSEAKDASAKALALIRMMLDTYKKGVTMTTPDGPCYRYALEAAARSKEDLDLGAHVDEILSKMKDAYLVPDTRCYTFAIQTWKNSALNQKQAPTTTREVCVRRAIDLLSEMEMAHNQSSSVDVVVSTPNVNDVLEALSVSTSLRRTEIAEGLLSKLETAADDEIPSLVPNADSYASALRVWRSVQSAEKVARAKLLVWRLKDKFESVSRQHNSKEDLVVVFNEFISVCSSYTPRSEKDGSQVLKEAIDVIELMLSFDGLQPNSETYCALLNCCASLLVAGHSRALAVERVFGFCCRDGLVDDKVLSTLRATTSSDEYSALVIAKSEEVDGFRLVPESFTRNVLGGKTISVDGRSTLPLRVDGRLAITSGMLEFRMRRLRNRKNQRLLRGGRLDADKEPKQAWKLSAS